MVECTQVVVHSGSLLNLAAAVRERSLDLSMFPLVQHHIQSLDDLEALVESMIHQASAMEAGVQLCCMLVELPVEPAPELVGILLDFVVWDNSLEPVVQTLCFVVPNSVCLAVVAQPLDILLVWAEEVEVVAVMAAGHVHSHPQLQASGHMY